MQIDKGYYSSEQQQKYSTEKELEHLIADYRLFPQGSIQKHIQKEIIIYYVQKENLQAKYFNAIPSQLCNQKCSLDKLKKIFLEKDDVMAKEVKQILGRNIKNTQLFYCLHLLKAKIMPIDVFKLERLIQKTKKAQKCIEKKDVLLFIGNTGCGKSTTILKFLGYNLKSGKVKKLPTLIPIQQLKKQHKNIQTSPQAKSCTQYINAIPVPSNMYNAQVAEQSKTIVLCDSPGFNDTSGVQVDIANGIGMKNAIYRANSVRVVVILPYDSITANRMDGIIQIGITVSNIYQQQIAFDSTIILFNKVPQQNIEELQKIIQNKITHLNNIQKGNHKLTMFLEKVLKQSKYKQNFLDPFQSDYKYIFNKICQRKPINDIKSCFQYQFSRKTKSEIKTFLRREANQFKVMFYKNIAEAEFHYKISTRLCDIVREEQFYQQMEKFITSSSKKLYEQFQAVMNSINWTDFRNQQQTLKNAKNIKNQLIQISNSFKHIYNIVSLDTINKIIRQKQEVLLEQWGNFFQITKEILNLIHVFSITFDQTFRKKVSYSVEKQYQSVYQTLQNQIKQSNYDGFDITIDKLNIVGNNFIMIEGRESIQVGRYRLIVLRNRLKNQIETIFKFIQKFTRQQQLALPQSIIQQLKLQLSSVKQIKSLKIMDCSQKQAIQLKLKHYLNLIQQRCRKSIDRLQNFRFYQLQNISFNKQNFLQMKIEIEKMILGYHYQDTIIKIKRNYETNLQKLLNFIRTFKHQTSKQVSKRVDTFKKYFTNLMDYCIIIDPKYNLTWIKQSIRDQLVEYFHNQFKKYVYLQTFLSTMSLQQFNKIQQSYLKIKIFEKIQGLKLGDIISSSVRQIKETFYKKIKHPFIQFNQSQISFIKQHKKYSLFHFSLPKLQKLSLYSLKIQQMLSNQEYDMFIQKEQVSFWKQLNEICLIIRKDVEKFIQSQFQYQNEPIYLKQLAKTLIYIKNSQVSASYLRKITSFQVQININRLKTKILVIRNQLQQLLKNLQNKIDELEKILTSCQFYVELEAIFKTKEKNNQSFGFKQLQKQCLNFIACHLKRDQEIVMGILIKKPNKIDFNQLKQYFEKFKSLKNKQNGKRCMNLIIKQLKKMEDSLFQKLNILQMQMQDSRERVVELLEAFEESVTLENNLHLFYNNLLIKNPFTQRLQNQIANFYLKEFGQLKSNPYKYSFNKQNQKIKKFHLLQSKVFQLFSIEKQLKASNSNEKDIWVQLIMYQVKELRQRIQSRTDLSGYQKRIAKKTNRLKELLLILYKGYENQQNEKYSVFQYIKMEKVVNTLYQKNDQKNKYANQHEIKTVLVQIQGFIAQKHKIDEGLIQEMLE